MVRAARDRCGRVGEVQLIPEGWMRQVSTPSPPNPNYGFQTWLGTVHDPVRGYGTGVPIGVPHSAPFVASDMIYFDGAGGRRVYIVHSRDLVIVRTGAGGIDFERGQFLWDDAIIPNATVRGILDPSPERSRVETD
jgi:CubicO group peptidase (beta-lactamase class C family)